MYDLIYCNGDSYAQGRDLVEHLYLQPKLYTFTEWKETQLDTVNQLVKWSKKFPREAEKIVDQEKSKSFANQLGDLTSIKVINNATSGYGFTMITKSALEDLVHLKKKHNKILFLVTLTNPERLWFPGDVGIKNKSHTIVVNGFNHYKGKLAEKVIKQYIMNTTHLDWIMQMAVSYLGLLHFCNESNIDMRIVGTPLMNGKHLQKYKQNGFEDIINLFENSYIGTLGGENISVDKDNESPIFTSGGHLPEKHHVKLAHEIKEMLWT